MAFLFALSVNAIIPNPSVFGKRSVSLICSSSRFGRNSFSSGYRHLRHVKTIDDLSPEEVGNLLQQARKVKAYPHRYNKALEDKTLLMLFEKPSLRTRVSFETGMTQLGGHAIFYSIADSPLGKKESLSDTAKVLSRMSDLVMARVKLREDIRELATLSTVPIINALDDYGHPCQILADLFTITEKRGSLKGLKMAYLGDCRNNVTYDLMRAACMMEFEIRVAGPVGPEYAVEADVIRECDALSSKYGGTYSILFTAEDAVRDVDVIYTDSWMSYGISSDKAAERKKAFMPFQVNTDLLKLARPDVIFMNCLPAMRGMEQTAEVIDGPHSIVFDQAENRLHAQKALLMFLHCGFDVTFRGAGSKPRVVVALGGNAIQKPTAKGTPQEMVESVDVASAQLAHLVESGYELVVTHGNGPQVGNIVLQNQIAASEGSVPSVDLSLCGAESQGLLGSVIQQCLTNQLSAKGTPKTVVSVVTQTVVNEKDPAFEAPSKPIGMVYRQDSDVDRLRAEGKTVMKTPRGDGWRVVVPSPRPLALLESPAIKTLVDAGHIVVASGGGGVPVVEVHSGQSDASFRRVDAVVDKDLTAVKLAEATEADVLLILTDVEYAYRDFGKPTETPLRRIPVSEASLLVNEGHFAKGSMEPKIRAAIEFVMKTGNDAIITSLDKAVDALEGKSGTRIVSNV